MMERWRIGVTIPARNEEEMFPRCLASVLDASSYLKGKADLDIAVVADRSNDQMLAVATQLLQGTDIANSLTLVAQGRLSLRLSGFF